VALIVFRTSNSWCSGRISSTSVPNRQGNFANPGVFSASKKYFCSSPNTPYGAFTEKTADYDCGNSAPIIQYTQHHSVLRLYHLENYSSVCCLPGREKPDINFISLILSASEAKPALQQAQSVHCHIAVLFFEFSGSQQERPAMHIILQPDRLGNNTSIRRRGLLLLRFRDPEGTYCLLQR